MDRMDNGPVAQSGWSVRLIRPLFFDKERPPGLKETRVLLKKGKGAVVIERS